MTHAPRRFFHLALGVALLAPTLPFASAHAQEDLAIPYSDEAHPPAKPAEEAPRNDTVINRDQTYAGQEDPTLGLGAELVGGLILLDSPRGQGTETRGTVGGRATWDVGRLFSDSTVHEGLFVDLTYLFTSLSDGTQSIKVSTAFHDLVLAPAFEVPFGTGSAWGAYVQAGAGASLEAASIQSTTSQSVSTLRPLIQYGIGLRGRPLLSEDGRTRITVRVEVTRFRRGYMNDTLFLASLGFGL